MAYKPGMMIKRRFLNEILIEIGIGSGPTPILEPDNIDIVIVNDGHTLFYDELTGQYFYSNINTVFKAIDTLMKYTIIDFNIWCDELGIRRLPNAPTLPMYGFRICLDENFQSFPNRKITDIS